MKLTLAAVVLTLFAAVYAYPSADSDNVVVIQETDGQDLDTAESAFGGHRGYGGLKLGGGYRGYAGYGGYGGYRRRPYAYSYIPHQRPFGFGYLG